MPYKSDKIKLPKDLDRRRKLLDCQRRLIKELYKHPLFSQRKLAKIFKVSRRLIQFILDPAKYEKSKTNFKEKSY